MRTKSPRGRSRARAAAGLSASFLGALLLSSPVVASTGLPDGRVYERVSPSEKNGNQAGVEETKEQGGMTGVTPEYAASAADGDGVLYFTTGPFGETNTGVVLYSVAHRSSSGWSAQAALPPAQGLATSNFFYAKPETITPSAGFDNVLFDAIGTYTARDPAIHGEGESAEGLFLAHEGTGGEYAEPAWLSGPTVPFAEAKPEPGEYGSQVFGPVGGSPDLNTVYFNAQATLVPEDAPRVAHVNSRGVGPSGFYEWHAGTLVSAGELPNGTYSPFGATAATRPDAGYRNIRPPLLDNDVSSDGSKAFFVSPDPRYASEAGTPTELYLRERTANGPASVLVSRTEAGTPAAGSGGEEAVAPIPIEWSEGHVQASSYVYASPDGSRAFFSSKDKLAKDATGHEPAGAGPWMYEFALATERVTYLPGVTGPILASSRDGSSFIAERQEPRPAEGSIREECEEGFLEGPECEPLAPAALDLWSVGHLSEIARWSAPSAPAFPDARATADGSVFAFATNAVLAGAKSADGSEPATNSGVHEQVYRYVTGSRELACVSCPGQGVQPLEGTALAHDNMRSFLGDRGMSADGSRLFFDTPQPLVAGDVNGVQDVYEWEGGRRYLISSGTSAAPSYFLDSSESGDDVFFTTSQGLVEGDTDESYDVYDARVKGGFPHQTLVAPCVSDCRPAGASPSLSAPITTATGPSGNIEPAPTKTSPRTTGKPPTRMLELARALKACRKKHGRNRAACERQARNRYGARPTARKAANRRSQ